MCSIINCHINHREKLWVVWPSCIYWCKLLGINTGPSTDWPQNAFPKLASLSSSAVELPECSLFPRAVFSHASLIYLLHPSLKENRSDYLACAHTCTHPTLIQISTSACRMESKPSTWYKRLLHSTPACPSNPISALLFCIFSFFWNYHKILIHSLLFLKNTKCRLSVFIHSCFSTWCYHLLYLYLANCFSPSLSSRGPLWEALSDALRWSKLYPFPMGTSKKSSFIHVHISLHCSGSSHH